MDDNRYEIKFVLSEAELSEALSWLYMVGARKAFPDRVVNSLYFDNPEFQAVRDNLAGISKRHKVRLRWYNDQNSSNKIEPKLEIKMRDGRLGSKFFYELPELETNLYKMNPMDIGKEVFSLLHENFAIHPLISDYLLPVLLVRYDREYYECRNGLRITIDKKIQFYDTAQQKHLFKTQSLKYHSYIMELKFPKEMKEDVSELLRPLFLVPKRHSKYLMGVSMLGYAQYI